MADQFEFRAAQYVRMSTEHQQYSTHNQADKIREYAEKRGIEIVRTYADDGKSGLSIGGRASLQRLIADVESGAADFNVILVYDVSRWGRFQDADESAYYEHICKRAGIQVAYCAEQFENDGSPVSTIVKGVKRAMAGEYSRELSVKVFTGQCRLIELGYRQGGPAGFGLRRVLIDERGTIKAELKRGEHKSLQTDRVILMPGPEEEVAWVNKMYRWLIEEDRPDGVMHLAAESHVDRSIDGPGDFIDTNITGTFNMLEAARKYWTAQGRPEGFRFHHVSTDEVFGSLPLDPSVKFTETTAYDPRSPYSASKAASDHLVRAWHETYGLPVVLSNCSNNYGPYHFPEKLIPVVILNALAGKPLPIYGDGSNVRDWLYVEDHADALLLVVSQGQVGRNYNIGGENERTNLQLVQTICAILDRQRPRETGAYADLITFVTDRPGHDARYAIDPSRIRTELGWRPSLTVEEGLERTVRWYLENEDWWRPLLARQGVGQRLGRA